ncbi:MAG: protoglobin domain-containing protein [Myxococcota bacterium]|nr:protoglobin domain-containing protein [Myxococcota bacterium]
MPVSKNLSQRLAYLNLGEQDRVALIGLRPLLEKNASSFVGAFYRHLLSFQPTRELLRDPGVKHRLLEKQRLYLLSLSEPTFDEAYVEDRRRIGVVHERIGLEPRWYLGAYTLYMSLLTPIICESYGHDPQTAMSAVLALQKVLTLDAELAMEAYIDRQHHELEYLTQELAEEGRRLSQDFEQQKAELQMTAHRAQAAEELASVATLVAGLAHEIGTPMGVIQGHAKLLERAVDDEDGVWRVRTIQEQIGRISNIIQTLLNMARPRATRRMPVALEPLVETSLSFLREKLGRRAIEVSTVIERTPSILGDSERIQQLLLNLFLNAADAMPDGGELRVTLGMHEGDVEVRIADTGVGISEDALPRLFEPFFTTKPAGEGNGLGLMVAKGIVSDHGGQIDVSSTPGVGTEFVIRFPPAQTEGGAHI